MKQESNFVIPDSVKSIGDYAFWGCTRLKNITMPDSVTSIGAYAFCDCTGLTNITIPDSVTSIEKEVFAGCLKLTKIVIPASVTKINEYVFRYQYRDFYDYEELEIFAPADSYAIKYAKKHKIKYTII